MRTKRQAPEGSMWKAEGAPASSQRSICRSSTGETPLSPDTPKSFGSSGKVRVSAGWLPAWLIRLRGQADYMKRALPEGVRDPVDYAREGRVFCGIELYEGEEMAKSINELLGDGVIMFQSDYPHNGCEYPNSPDIALQWTGIGETAMRKLMYDNAASYLRLA